MYDLDIAKKDLRKLAIALAVIMGLNVLVFVGRTFYKYAKENRELHQKVDDLQVSLAHATIPLQRDTIRDSIPVVRQKVVTIDKTDYKRQVADAQLIKDLKLKVSRIEAENDILKSTRDTVTLQPAQDSLLKYRDRWTSFEYDTGTRRLAYTVRDSIVTFVDRIPKHRFLFWQWGTKGYNITHVNFNPNSSIEYSRLLLVGK